MAVPLRLVREDGPIYAARPRGVNPVRMIAAAAEDPALSGTAVRVLALLADYWNADEGYAWPSQGTLAARLRVRRQAVNQAIKLLARAGYVEVEHRYEPGTREQAVARYRLREPSGGSNATLLPSNERLLGSNDRRTGVATPRCVGSNVGRTEPVPSEPVPSEPVPREGAVAPPAPERPKRRSAKTGAPDGFPLDDGLLDYAAGKGLDRARAEAETERFLNYHRAKGSLFLDWAAAWRNWIGRVLEYGPRPAPARNGAEAAPGPRRDKLGRELSQEAIEDAQSWGTWERR